MRAIVIDLCRRAIPYWQATPLFLVGQQGQLQATHKCRPSLVVRLLLAILLLAVALVRDVMPPVGVLGERVLVLVVGGGLCLGLDVKRLGPEESARRQRQGAHHSPAFLKVLISGPEMTWVISPARRPSVSSKSSTKANMPGESAWGQATSEGSSSPGQATGWTVV